MSPVNPKGFLGSPAGSGWVVLMKLKAKTLLCIRLHEMHQGCIMGISEDGTSTTCVGLKHIACEDQNSAFVGFKNEGRNGGYKGYL